MATWKEQERAMELIKEAMDHQLAGELDEAIRLYKESIALYPTADAHTYLGWTYRVVTSGYHRKRPDAAAKAG